ncbi:Erythronate-4-phosphate dehydrogenase family protein [Forsythia ovata]|uniref:Erythronate-4-phosphate dehydrogenase family protein n=1 Tax=Forsythia ovata TaxID=205694 RepID=A0ABD1U7U9_9LAMI
MENSYELHGNGNLVDPGLQIKRHSLYQSGGKFSLPWFDIRVFYVRICNFMVDESTPESLTLNHIPLSPDTLLEVNGVRCSIDSEGVSCLLRRDRVDKKSEEVTFVSTDGIRLTGSVKFEVFDREDLVLFGVLEIPNTNGFIRRFKKRGA